MRAPGRNAGTAGVVIVEASAGAGKTRALAERYIGLLSGAGTPPAAMRGILAITFTNAAARSMKERILGLLKERALGAKSAAARARARGIVDYLVGHYSHFQVQTIDSFVKTLITGCAAELRLSASFEVREDAGAALAAGLDECIDAARRDRRLMGLFRRFLDQFLLLERRSGWFAKDDALGLVASLFTVANTREGRFSPSGVRPAAPSRRRSVIRRMLAELEGALPEGAHARFGEAIRACLGRTAAGFDLSALRSAYFTRDEIPLRKGAAADAAASRRWRRVREEIARLALDEARSLADCPAGIFRAVMARVEERARRDDVVFLDELNRLAAGIFAGSGMPVPEIYYRLACRFSHYLIDEFQDTSPLQWGNVREMVREALSVGGSLFYVGDRKQAIYRFRGGDVGLFEGVAADLGRHAPVRREGLPLNRRSRREIVRFNNEVFSSANVERFLRAREARGKEGPARLGGEEIARIAAIFGAEPQETPEEMAGGCVRVARVPDGDERDARTREMLARLLREIAGRYRPGEIAVLVRENAAVELVTAWLIEDGLETESEKTLNILNNPRIKEILSLLAFLHAPADDLAFASFITGDLFAGASGIPPAETRAFILSLGGRSARRGGPLLYRAFRDRFPAAWDAHLDAAFRNAGFMPLYELVADIAGRFRVCERFGGSTAHVMRLLELIREGEEERPAIDEFLRSLDAAGRDDLYVRAAGADAVRVMTVHKAKGLQFPAVILPYFGVDPGGRGPVRPAVEETADGFRLIRLDARYARLSPEVAAAARRERERRWVDELDVAYVACTRAADELHLFIPAGEGDDGCLIPEGCMARGGPGRGRGGGARGEGPTPALEPSFGDWRARVREERLDPALLRRRADARRGEIVHFILSRIGNLHGVDPERALRDAAAAARRLFPAPAPVDACAAAARALISSASAAMLFDAPGAEVRTEWEVADEEGRLRRIDRLVLSAGGALVADFKSTAAAPAAYREQVREYMRIAAAVFPGRAVSGVVAYIEEGRVEAV
ncbi:MAG: UvrD-helicase domain-containing protein [bacterium]|nr:UvrD-helicase domain-containing protein [bacterium]